MKYFWAGILILLGALFLAGNFNLLSGVDLANVLRFWPLILVLWGLYLIIRNKRGADTVMIVALVFSALLVGGYAYLNPRTENNGNRPCCENEHEIRERTIESEMPIGATKAKITVNTGAVKFDINGGTSKLIEGDVISNFMEPRLKTTVSGEEVTAVLDSTTYRRMMFFFRDFKNELSLKLNDTFPVNLEVNTGASDLNFDLSKIRLSAFLLKAGASDLDLRIGNLVQNDANIDIEAGASSVKVAIPQEIGVRIVNESGLGSTDFPGFIKKSDTVWESEGYDVATKKINLSFRAGASSLKVTRD